MPTTKSAKKALRQSIKRRERNLKRKKRIRDLTKKIKNLLSKNKKEEAEKLLPWLYKALDKSAKVGVIKKNTANRKKARITSMINKGKS